MSLTATLQPTLARVKLEIDGLTAAGSDLIRVERSLDEVNWTTVRAGRLVEVTGDTHDLYDYEWTPGVQSFYRVLEVPVIAYVGVGAVDTNTGNTTGRTVTPGLPASIEEGDLLVIWLGLSNHSVVGSSDATAPAGWSTVLDHSPRPGAMSNYIFTKIAGASESAPDIGIGTSGGEAAQMAAWRGADLPPDFFASDSEYSGTSSQIQFPALTVPGPHSLAVAFGISGAAWTSVAASTGFTLVDDPTVDIGFQDVSICWQYQIMDAAEDIDSDFFAITGGTHNNTQGHGAVFPFGDPAETELFTDDLTPTLTDMWLKLPSNATLNTTVTLQDFSQINRPGRLGILPVKGRAAPVAVTDTRGLRQLVVVLRGDTEAKTDEILDLLESGEVLFLHVPTTSKLRRSMYLAVGDASKETTGVPEVWRLVSMDSTEVAAPGPDIFGDDPADPA